MIKTQRWRPDTCGCVLLQDWDTENSNISLKHFESKCAAHEMLSDADAYHVIYGSGSSSENRRKNLIHKMILDHFPEIAAGNGFKDGVSTEWEFTGNGKGRVLKIRLNGHSMSASKRTQLQSKAHSDLGHGKVEIL